MSNQFSLLTQNKFKPFFVTQFLGAFNDNVFKTALISLIAFKAMSVAGLSSSMLTTLLPGLFILPYMLLSGTAGQIADKFEKSYLIRMIKVAEVGIMCLASVGFYLENLWMLSFSLFLMGVHSTLFGPVKYSYLPQHLNEKELVGGNGLIEMGTFIAIILGQVLGAYLAASDSYKGLTSLAVVGISLAGVFSSRFIPITPASDSSIIISRNPLKESLALIKNVWSNQILWTAIIAISWFWFMGATLLAQFPSISKMIFRGNESDFITMLAVFSMGVGVGSVWCEKLSKGTLEMGLILIGGALMSVFSFDLYYATSIFSSIRAALDGAPEINWTSSWSSIRILADIGLLGVSGGIMIVPLYVLLQTKSDPKSVSRVIAANNIMNSLFMIISAGVSMLVLSLQFKVLDLIFISAVLNIFALIYLCFRQPLYLTTFLNLVSKKHKEL